jgi:predicted  nucleic acid-binding Zn-ribbon protein
MALECLKCHATYGSGTYDPEVGCPVCGKDKKQTSKNKLIDFLKWANENHVELQIQYSFNDRIGVIIYNTEDGEELHHGFGDTIEEAIEHLQDSISEIGHLPVKFYDHNVIYDFPWDK